MAAPKSPLRDPGRVWAFESLQDPSERVIVRHRDKTAEDRRKVSNRNRVVQAILRLPAESRQAYADSVGFQPGHLLPRHLADADTTRKRNSRHPGTVRL